MYLGGAVIILIIIIIFRVFCKRIYSQYNYGAGEKKIVAIRLSRFFLLRREMRMRHRENKSDRRGKKRKCRTYASPLTAISTFHKA